MCLKSADTAMFRDFFPPGLQGNNQLVDPVINVGSIHRNNKSRFYKHVVGIFISMTTLFKL